MSGSWLSLSFTVCLCVFCCGDAQESMVRGDWIGLYLVFVKVYFGSWCSCGLVVCVGWNGLSCLASVVFCGVACCGV